ncbi:hypothetical protein JYU34_010555 [Plutella xylostella]|uniref:Uncharacterized protein n=1 Tax=Plutella xylostella TaxID=51655 RepID=A0ABQ7QIN6_PLUXY|nr:hypothetical protein JYU34_010555 [Plutella xylostella]
MAVKSDYIFLLESVAIFNVEIPCSHQGDIGDQYAAHLSRLAFIASAQPAFIKYVRSKVAEGMYVDVQTYELQLVDSCPVTPRLDMPEWDHKFMSPSLRVPTEQLLNINTRTS